MTIRVKDASAHNEKNVLRNCGMWVIHADYLAMFADEEMPKDEHQRSSVLEKEKTEYFT